MICIHVTNFFLFFFFKAVPALSPFKPEEFLTSIDQSGPQLTTGVKGDWTGLYRRFLRTVNFESWFQLRLLEANKKLVALHMEALSQSVRLSHIKFIENFFGNSRNSC